MNEPLTENPTAAQPSRYTGWTRQQLVNELSRLRHRRDHMVLSAGTRAEEDAQIDDIIARLRN